jgi:hypothetical protein
MEGSDPCCSVPIGLLNSYCYAIRFTWPGHYLLMASGAKGCVTAYDVYVRFRAKYVSICNMLALFKFAIPVIIDYGSAIKLGDYTV